jgi:flavin-binding protein dodecin
MGSHARPVLRIGSPAGNSDTLSVQFATTSSIEPEITPMSVAKHIELTADSSTSFEDAISKGVAKAGETVDGITAVWVQGQQALVENGKVTTYRVQMKVTFVLND